PIGRRTYDRSPDISTRPQTTSQLTEERPQRDVTRIGRGPPQGANQRNGGSKTTRPNSPSTAAPARAGGGCAPHAPAGASARRSWGAGLLAARALELVEVRGAGDQERAVPQPPGLLAVRDLRDDRAEEHHRLGAGAGDRDHWGAGLAAHERHGLGVG